MSQEKSRKRDPKTEPRCAECGCEQGTHPAGTGPCVIFGFGPFHEHYCTGFRPGERKESAMRTTREPGPGPGKRFCTCPIHSDDEMDRVLRVIRRLSSCSDRSIVQALGEIEGTDHHPTCAYYRVLLERCEMRVIEAAMVAELQAGRRERAR